MNILDLIRPPEIKVNPASTAIFYNNEEITYRTINSLVNKTSYFLNEKCVKKNDIVTLLFSNSLEFIVTLLSLWEIGAVPVPLNIKLSEKELNEQVELLKPQISIKEKSFSHLSLQGKSITFSLNDVPESNTKITQKKFSTDKTALILFTSGSSDKPKAVMLGFNNLIQSALIGNKVLNQTNKDTWIASLPFYHIGGFSIVFRALFFGASLIIPASLSNEDLKDSINHHRPTLASLVSNQLKKFVDENFVLPVELRMVLLGGGFFDTDLILKAITQGWKIAKVYGSTETSSFVSFMNTNEV
ncbi:MAG TPA: AMP-binding protein, partial [Ignavibacteriaceae bacterium]